MGRLVAYLAVAAAGLGVILLLSGADAETAAPSAVHAFLTQPITYGGWVVGLLMGLALAWLRGFDWRSLPERLALWMRLFRRRLWWMICGGVFASVLLFF
jgi:hypothetical protein